MKILTDNDDLITSNNCFPKQMVGLAGSVVSWMTRSPRYLDSDVLNQPISDTDVRAVVSKLKAGKA